MRLSTTRRSLLLRLRDHADQDAWTEFHALYAPLAVRVIRRALPAADRDDVLQEVMLALASSMPSFEYDPARGRFRGLLQTITQRAIAKKLRQIHAGPGKTSLESCVEPAVEDQNWEQAWRQHHMELALARVESECSERDRQAFRRYAIEGGDPKAAAEEFGISLDQLYKIKSRMLKRLGQYVEAQIESEAEHD